MKMIPRSGWGAREASSVTPSEPRNLKGVVVHWFGSPRQAVSHAGCDDLLRGVQRGHMAGEFNDIAYNHGVCPHGYVYELRGFNRRTGANGTHDTNEDYASVVYMSGLGDPPPSSIALFALSDIIAEWERRGTGKAHRTHGSITGSECPGPHLTRWVRSKGWNHRRPVNKRLARRWRLVWRHGIPYTEEV